jgi:RTX calcium-binding nonapeptide repeat (4 copies)
MRLRVCYGALALGLALLVFSSIVTSFAATNSVAPSRLDDTRRPITANDLKPSQCTMNLTEIVAGGGTLSGGPGNSLILGSAGPDIIRARNGDDCILGGGDADVINGGPGTDVCIGGGQAGDSFIQCETIIR